MTRPEMILFDYGGTLLCEPDFDMLRGEEAVFEHVIRNPGHYTPACLSAWEKTYYRSLQAIRDAGAELTEIQLLRLKYELHGIELDIPYEEAELILWEHASPMTERCVYPHLRQALESIHEQGIRAGVISNIGWTGAALARRIDILLPENHFEFIIASSDYGLRKPDARLFRLALARAGLPPEKVWFCGDTYDKDIEGARSAGLFPVFYQGHVEGDARDAAAPVPIPADAVTITDWLELLDILKRADAGA